MKDEILPTQKVSVTSSHSPTFPHHNIAGQEVAYDMLTHRVAHESLFKCETDDENEYTITNHQDFAPSMRTRGNDGGNEQSVNDEPNDDSHTTPTQCRTDSNKSTTDTGDQPNIKEEPTIYELQQKQTKDRQKYGDRVLLARQARNGMLKLGGGNVSSQLWPKNPKERLARMGGRYAVGYNDLWNFGAPKFAGDPSGHVTWFPRDDSNMRDPIRIPFSVFVKRTVKGSALVSLLFWYTFQDIIISTLIMQF